MHSDLISSAYVAFFCSKEDKGAYRVAFPRRVHDQALVANDLRDLEAIFERAATGPDIQADERSALQNGFESAAICVFYVTTQSENHPEVGAHAVYLNGTSWLEIRDQHEERNQLEFHCGLKSIARDKRYGRCLQSKHRRARRVDLGQLTRAPVIHF